ncbi:MAG: hypothetical protein OEX00_04110, partial [Gammaproteobacteria bacterium]|nr:hypothetical protein [Gammaproteobacteria bacterium]
MKRLIGCLIASSFLFCSNSALSQSQIDIPLIDAPYNADHPEQWPSMNQSLHWVRSTYAAAHHGLTQWRDEKGKNPTMWIIGFDFMMTWFPLGSSWLHEEWHRAVMGQYGIDSYDEVNDIPLFAETISVSHVKDEDLAWLKANHPADFVRLSSAGLEAQNELNFLVEQDQFFKDSPTDNLFLLWSNYINNWGYLDACASEDSTKITKELQDAEGANISKRDFTGLDCNAWVYDLFRPQEAYADRGLHPSGTGVRRYRTFEDLTQEEKDYLTKQSRLSLLNLVNPFLINRVHFSAQFEGRQVLWNASLRHHITPFGYNLGVNVFLRSA